jgi:hypothetical protein
VAGPPSGLHVAARTHPDRAGTLEIPTYERIEEPWPVARVPAWFHAVPQRPARRWTNTAGRTAPHYAEFIVRDLLDRDGWSAVWVKNFGGRAFWTSLGRGGPVAVDLQSREARLIGDIDALVRAHALGPRRNTSGPQAAVGTHSLGVGARATCSSRRRSRASRSRRAKRCGSRQASQSVCRSRLLASSSIGRGSRPAPKAASQPRALA